jgi:hypothetical protein
MDDDDVCVRNECVVRACYQPQKFQNTRTFDDDEEEDAACVCVERRDRCAVQSIRTMMSRGHGPSGAALHFGQGGYSQVLAAPHDILPNPVDAYTAGRANSDVRIRQRPAQPGEQRGIVVKRTGSRSHKRHTQDVAQQNNRFPPVAAESDMNIKPMDLVYSYPNDPSTVFANMAGGPRLMDFVAQGAARGAFIASDHANESSELSVQTDGAQTVDNTGPEVIMADDLVVAVAPDSKWVYRNAGTKVVPQTRPLRLTLDEFRPPMDVAHEQLQALLADPQTAREIGDGTDKDLTNVVAQDLVNGLAGFAASDGRSARSRLQRFQDALHKALTNTIAQAHSRTLSADFNPVRHVQEIGNKVLLFADSIVRKAFDGDDVALQAREIYLYESQYFSYEVVLLDINLRRRRIVGRALYTSLPDGHPLYINLGDKGF